MSAVEILASGTAADAGSSEPVDCSAFSTLRLDLELAADTGRSPTLDVYIESAPTDEGPWTTHEHRRYSTSGPDAWSQSRRFALAGFDSFVRLRWSGAIKRIHAAGSGLETANLFTIGLAGDGQPDAE